MKRPTVGVIGGMGPQATAEFYRRLVAMTPARGDDEHLHVLIDSDPSIPSRQDALAGRGKSPLARLIIVARRLESAGATCLAMPCNTAHAWYKELQEAVSIPIINMIEETVHVIRHTPSSPQELGVLATHGALHAELYEKAFGDGGPRLCVPDPEQCQEIMDAVAGVKAGSLIGRRQVAAVARSMLDRGADAILVGCTEVSLLIQPDDVEAEVIDSMSVLARATVSHILALTRALA
ncbi:amino acid racemase [Candidatus Bipolaricaulota bacterium]|nr:amino acid racemase [Candidatus Bipolaricaulota bacterium]